MRTVRLGCSLRSPIMLCPLKTVLILTGDSYTIYTEVGNSVTHILTKVIMAELSLSYFFDVD